MNPIGNPAQYPPLTLAFVGDAVFSLRVRQGLVEKQGAMPPGQLHRITVQYVCADAQARLYDLLEASVGGDTPLLDEQEYAVMKRGRNASSASVPKHADPAHYRKATAIETLFGYLQLSGRYDRLDTLTALVFADAM